MTKIYKRRDSATTALRKMGVTAKDYGTYIQKISDSEFACNLAQAQEDLQAALKKPKKKIPKKKVISNKVSDRITISSMCRELILAGASNEQIFNMLQTRFGSDRITANKRGYPAWYRSDLKRKGALPPAFHASSPEGIPDEYIIKKFV